MKTKNWWIVLLILTATFSNCKKEKSKPQDKPATFEEIKTIDWRSKIGDSVEVIGYLNILNDGTAILLSDKSDIETNSFIPETKYIALGSEFIRNLNPVQYYLAKVKIKGKIRVTTNQRWTLLNSLTGDLSQFEIESLTFPVIIEVSPGKYPENYDPCKLYPALCNPQGSPFSEKYAILYVSGFSLTYRAWNDMAIYYYLLKNVCGFDPAKIYVLYLTGNTENPKVPVWAPANKSSLTAAFSALTSRMKPNDQFFFYASGMGFEWPDAESPITGDEYNTSDNKDECLLSLNNPDPKIFDDEVSDMVNKLKFSRMICILQQSFSGGMVYDLRGPNRLILTSCTSGQKSLGSGDFDDFSRNLAEALYGMRIDSYQKVDADANKDGKVSITEAFRWAKDHDLQNESPQYEDNGDGISVNYPSESGSVNDGAYGKSVFFPF